MTMVEGSDMADPRDQFPIGMRVLAVDDDPTCLKVLETLLRRCQYHVTVAKHAITALKLLRENKNKFDLVISDVVMPDMDGFKLLEHVGHEMDLPVIMLSENDDPKMVMKGIAQGACDYLLKPIRIEELKNIWQHVMRRKKIDTTSNQEMLNSGNTNAVESTETGNLNQNGILKKRKTRDGENHGNSHDDEEPSTHKKHRVVWSAELHRKFVAAVNQIGVEKAVPKKILDLMNVEKLTRENVASHLQKYRLYLKRISSATNQQPNMVAALGSFGPFQSSSGSGQFHNNSVRSFPISISNTPIGLNVHGLPYSGTRRNGGVQGIGGSSSLVPDISNNALMLEAKPQATQGGGLNENSNSVASQHSEISFSLVDNGRSNDVWSTAVQTFKRNYYLPSEGFRDASMHSQGVFSTNSQTPVNVAADPEGYNSTNSTFNRNLDFSFCDPLKMKHAEIVEFNEENSLKPHQVYTMNQQKSQNSCIDNNLGSVEDIIIAMMNEKDDEVKLFDGDFFLCDNDYSGWTSM